MSRTALIDYGSGNLHSCARALAAAADAGHSIDVTADPAALAAADRIVLPGVGHFADCAGALRAIPGMVEALEDAVLTRQRPFLGICVGMQLMADIGLEDGETRGLGWIHGLVEAFEPAPDCQCHMSAGTSSRSPATTRSSPVSAPSRHAYFTHSYAFRPEDEARCRRLVRLWQPLRRRPRPCQPLRHPVPPGEKPEAGADAPQQFPEVVPMTFTLYPAIDLKDGACVRLLRGEMDAATVFNTDPARAGRGVRARWASPSSTWSTSTARSPARRSTATPSPASSKATPAPVQLGGGIRTRAQIDAWLEAGIARVILGTVALRDPDLVKTAARDLPGRIVVGIDAKDGMVAVEGWAETSDMRATELAKAFEGCGVAAIIATDISRDGLKTGVNVPFTAELANTVTIPIIASGGVKSVDDIRALRASGAPIAGHDPGPRAV